MITVTFYGSLTQESAWLNFYLEVLASMSRIMRCIVITVGFVVDYVIFVLIRDSVK